VGLDRFRRETFDVSSCDTIVYRCNPPYRESESKLKAQTARTDSPGVKRVTLRPMEWMVPATETADSY
jgi:hypothetical protein